MRIQAILGFIVIGLAFATPASSADPTTPRLAIGSTQTLSVIGTGFTPRTFLTLRVAAPARLRVIKVWTGTRGGFSLALAALDRCEPLSISARTPKGAVTRASIVRRTGACTMPPPLQPSVPPPRN